MPLGGGVLRLVWLVAGWLVGHHRAGQRARDDAATWMRARRGKNNPGVTAPYCSVRRSRDDQSIWHAIHLFAAACSNRKLIGENSQSVCSSARSDSQSIVLIADNSQTGLSVPSDCQLLAFASCLAISKPIMFDVHNMSDGKVVHLPGSACCLHTFR